MTENYNQLNIDNYDLQNRVTTLEDTMFWVLTAKQKPHNLRYEKLGDDLYNSFNANEQ
jgi:hypothetical protein